MIHKMELETHYPRSIIVYAFTHTRVFEHTETYKIHFLFIIKQANGKRDEVNLAAGLSMYLP